MGDAAAVTLADTAPEEAAEAETAAVALAAAATVEGTALSNVAAAWAVASLVEGAALDVNAEITLKGKKLLLKCWNYRVFRLCYYCLSFLKIQNAS